MNNIKPYPIVILDENNQRIGVCRGVITVDSNNESSFDRGNWTISTAPEAQVHVYKDVFYSSIKNSCQEEFFNLQRELYQLREVNAQLERALEEQAN